jgi:hypothetical protein
MPNRTPSSMAPAEIAAEITQLRNNVEGSVARIHELSRILLDRMRRQRMASTVPDPNLDVYVTYANHWSRFAGMVQQGLQRTRQADRLLRMLREDEEQAAERADRPARPEPANSHPQPVPDQARSMPADSPLRDLIELYGEEIVQDADGQRPR